MTVLLVFFLVHLLPFTVFSKKSYRGIYLADGNYSKEDAPYEVTEKSIVVSLDPNYIVLVGMEENTQLVSYMVALNYSWQDSRLSFDPAVIGYNSVVVPTSLIWIPPLYCWNCVEVKTYDKNTDSDDVRIFSDGTVYALFRARLDTICQSDISAFPFDVQFCSINFDGGQVSANQTRFHPIVNSPRFQLIGTPEWKIEYNNFTLFESDDEISLTIIFKLTRTAEFYIFLMILPTLVITSICLLGILLPMGLQNGEKINMGVTGLLGLTFLLSILVVQVPRSKSLPLLGTWLLIEMFFCVLAMVISHPISKFKRKFFRKTASSRCLDVAVFVVVFGANILTSLLMFIFPHALKTAPEKPF